MLNSDSETRSQTKRLSSASRQDIGESSQPDFEAWYSRYGNELLRFCQSRLGATSGEDVFQQVWLKVMRKPEQFTGGNERAWLFQIARTSIIDFLRKKNPESQSETIEISADNESTSALDQMVASEDYSQFKNCLDQLSEEKKSLVQLRVIGQSYKQISETLSIAIGTVGSQYNRICEQLRNCVNQVRTA